MHPPACPGPTVLVLFFGFRSPQANPGRGERAYSDLEVIKELRAMSNANKRQEKVAPRVAGGGRLQPCSHACGACLRPKCRTLPNKKQAACNPVFNSLLCTCLPHPNPYR